ncbi:MULTISPECIES: transposase [unclassified Mesorhizobium]|uniref:transposase n=1 Tax=unclassified Mesorhizobium TaxID=325217 RepID=UPI0032AFF3F3
MVGLAPSATTFEKGRDFSAWLGLAPLQRPTGGSRSSAQRRRWASEPCGACLSSERAPWFAMRLGVACRKDRGLGACSPANRACLWSLLLPTRWPHRLGAHGSVTQTKRPPENPARFMAQRS